MDTTQFHHYCRKELVKHYERLKQGQLDNKQKYRTEGLLHAARMLGVMSETEISVMVEQEHQNVFSQSIAERKAQKTALAQLKHQSPDEYYEIPAIERKR